MIGRDPNYSRPLQSTPSMRISCTRSHKYYDFCFINGSTILDPTTSTFFVADPASPPLVEKIKPYPRNVGLISHGLVTINPKLLHTPKTLVHFHGILDKAFGRNHHHPRTSDSWPRLVLISRTGGVGREMLNQNEVKQAAEKVGFEVVVFVPSSTTDMHVAYNLLSKSHAMVGVHGAAMTHLLFMRPGSYIDYRINVEESSLVDKYGKDDIVVKDPVSKMGSNWSVEIMKIYLKEQNVKLDLDRFNWFLKAAYDKAKKFMDKEG
ncbi:PREDICTED: EGF domain-specific O-linked [Prunus dulcis]|uniref:PREDICTED: EGF domain-specific O-linked n=1 Tax=Prunus dulcis TaxID=3755 RepID=A0A5E4G3C8_PRUDU|nr:PREDICTED: EGF domain-specific O-linked [Prunus dulcis]